MGVADLFPHATPVVALPHPAAAALSTDDLLHAHAGLSVAAGGGGSPSPPPPPPDPPSPVVLTGGCHGVASKWARPGYLAASTQEGLEVDIDVAPPAASGHFPDTRAERERLGIRETTVLFADLLDGPGAAGVGRGHFAYLQQQSWAFDTLFPALGRDMRDPELACPALAGLAECACAKILWIGLSPTCSQLHFDRKDNLICQMCGEKEILLFGPEQTPFLYQGGNSIDCLLAQVFV